MDICVVDYFVYVVVVVNKIGRFWFIYIGCFIISFINELFMLVGIIMDS